MFDTTGSTDDASTDALPHPHSMRLCQFMRAAAIDRPGCGGVVFVEQQLPTIGTAAVQAAVAVAIPISDDASTTNAHRCDCSCCTAMRSVLIRSYDVRHFSIAVASNLIVVIAAVAAAAVHSAIACTLGTTTNQLVTGYFFYTVLFAAAATATVCISDATTGIANSNAATCYKRSCVGAAIGSHAIAGVESWRHSIWQCHEWLLKRVCDAAHRIYTRRPVVGW
jgi:hypothetical protein